MTVKNQAFKKVYIDMGRRAFRKGINAPASDPELMAELKGVKVGDKTTIMKMRAWVEGWTIEHMDYAEKRLIELKKGKR